MRRDTETKLLGFHSAAPVGLCRSALGKGLAKARPMAGEGLGWGKRYEHWVSELL